MTIIGISGASGSGKSTISKKLNELLPNSAIIYGDPYMMELAQTMETEIFSKLGQKKEKGVFSSNYFFQSLENEKIFINVIKKELTKLIELEIENKHHNKDYLIIDWVFLPLCNLFDKCDITICVNTDYETRLERLKIRMKNEKVHNRNWNLLEKYKPETLERRAKFTALNDFGYTYTYYIENNETEKELLPKIKTLSKKIKNHS